MEQLILKYVCLHSMNNSVQTENACHATFCQFYSSTSMGNLLVKLVNDASMLLIKSTFSGTQRQTRAITFCVKNATL